VRVKRLTNENTCENLKNKLKKCGNNSMIDDFSFINGGKGLKLVNMPILHLL